MNPQIRVLAIVVLIVASAGCVYVPDKTYHSVDYDRTIERVDGELRMDGRVEIDSGAAPPRTFRDVTLVFYESPDQVVDRVYLGDMSSNRSVAPKRRPINLTVEPAPKYIYIESPNFWTEKPRYVDAFRWNGNEYEKYAIESEDEKF